MKKKKSVLVTCAAMAVLAACATPPAPTSVIEYNYRTDNAKANGIVQVFDLSGNTVVQIRGLNPITTQFLNAKNAPIAFKVVGENVILAGMYETFTVSTATAASRVVRNTPMPIQPALAGAAVAKPNGAAESDAVIVAEILRIRKELAELKVMLAASSARVSQPTTPAVAETPGESAAEASVVIVSFANNSRQFTPASDQRSQLVALSQNARNISVRGYTDSEYRTPGSTALAKARAEAAKRYLVSMGVTAGKIIVDYEGAGNFIAENRSPAGKAANRRVEIGGS